METTMPQNNRFVSNSAQNFDRDLWQKGFNWCCDLYAAGYDATVITNWLGQTAQASVAAATNFIAPPGNNMKFTGAAIGTGGTNKSPLQTAVLNAIQTYPNGAGQQQLYANPILKRFKHNQIGATLTNLVKHGHLGLTGAGENRIWIFSGTQTPANVDKSMPRRRRRMTGDRAAAGIQTNQQQAATG